MFPGGLFLNFLELHRKPNMYIFFEFCLESRSFYNRFHKTEFVILSRNGFFAMQLLGEDRQI